MDRFKELQEAKTAAQEVVARIDNAIASLDSAADWGIFDLFGGGMFSSFMKRDKIKDANDDLKEISDSLRILNQELEDVNMHLPETVSDTVCDNALDIWFDNVFTDARVQKEIKTELERLKEFRASVVKLIERLTIEMETGR
ncbi:hypothetical protein [Suipraeoptans intestinalis]|uniref:Uncharacterized protein n=1 Tax=Suipraeoptans intestinalis TaxID=2606628 RepID=A0A6N7USM3_9FIRM|nr:hypothetical protein [Suipraeoptans intestinalis]MDD7769749.1 hypothetical protein [Suipraeoptans intestinalis]MDY3121249.1 hypothetical protein [Suipraeoptans intestinalis]MSR93778.1 hypothetical protein [Suipraeoptans intestinalis]